MTRLAPMLWIAVAACSLPEEKDDSGEAGPEDSGDAPEVPFDTGCFAQVMFTQTVCACSEIVADWSGLTADGGGEPFAPSDVQIVHWYVLGLPPSTLNTMLCSGSPPDADVLAGSATSPGGATSLTFDVGEGWSRETGVIALYDTTDEDSAPMPRAAGIFTFDEAETSNVVTIEDRGDVWTAP